MKVSVIIVNYNTYDLTFRCIESVLNSMHKWYIEGEIIVVDNKSPDGSGERLAETFKEVDEVKVILNQNNDGFSIANNLGLKKARGEYLLLLNSDTIIEEDTLAGALEFLEENKDYDVLGCKVVLENGDLDKACKRSFPTPLNSLFHFLKLDSLFKNSRLIGSYNLTYLDEDKIAEVDCIMGAFMFLRRKVYETVGGLDEDYFMYGEDVDWCYRIRKAGYRIIYYPQVQITHYKKASWNGKVNPKVLEAFYDSMLIFYNKHYTDKYPKVVDYLVKAGTSSLKKLAKIKNRTKQA